MIGCAGGWFLSFCNSLAHNLSSVLKICILAGRTERWTLASTVWTVETRGGLETRQVLFNFVLFYQLKIKSVLIFDIFH